MFVVKYKEKIWTKTDKTDIWKSFEPLHLYLCNEIKITNNPPITCDVYLIKKKVENIVAHFDGQSGPLSRIIRYVTVPECHAGISVRNPIFPGLRQSETSGTKIRSPGIPGKFRDSAIYFIARPKKNQ